MKLVKESGTDVQRNQMSLISDTDEVVKFLEFAESKSILNGHTVLCRLTACHNLFSILHEGEDSVEYMLQNLDLLVNRFRNKNPNVQASTLKVYKSRVKSSLEDFNAWRKDPLAWEKTVLDKSRLQQSRERKVRGKAKPKAQAPVAPREAQCKQKPPERERVESAPKVTLSPEISGVRRLSFPIRPDFNLEVTLPAAGLSLKELLRLGLFLYPYCKELEGAPEAAAWTTVLSGVPN